MHLERGIWDTIFKAKEEVVHRTIAGECLLIPVKGKLADMQYIFALNTIGEFIWERLDGKNSTEDIRNDLLTHFDVQKQQADSDIQKFISELLKQDLIIGNH